MNLPSARGLMAQSGVAEGDSASAWKSDSPNPHGVGLRRDSCFCCSRRARFFRTSSAATRISAVKVTVRRAIAGKPCNWSSPSALKSPYKSARPTTRRRCGRRKPATMPFQESETARLRPHAAHISAANKRRQQKQLDSRTRSGPICHLFQLNRQRLRRKVRSEPSITDPEKEDASGSRQTRHPPRKGPERLSLQRRSCADPQADHPNRLPGEKIKAPVSCSGILRCVR